MTIAPWLTRRRAAARAGSIKASQPSGCTARAASEGQMVLPAPRCASSCMIVVSSARSTFTELFAAAFVTAVADVFPVTLPLFSPCNGASADDAGLLDSGWVGLVMVFTSLRRCRQSRREQWKGFALFVINPGTLVRTWGTRLVLSGMDYSSSIFTSADHRLRLRRLVLSGRITHHPPH